jgi:hypothetical protein
VLKEAVDRDLVAVDDVEDTVGQAGLLERELDVLDAARDLPQGVRGDLAVLGGQEAGDLGAMLVDEVADAEEDLGAPREGGGAPLREGFGGRSDGGVDLLDGGEVDLTREPAGGGLPDRPVPAGGSGHAPAADPMIDPLGARRRRLATRCLRLCDLRHP